MKRKLDDPTHSSTKPTVNFAMADDLLSQPFVGSEDNDVGIINDNTINNPTLEKEGVDILSLDVCTNIKSPSQIRVDVGGNTIDRPPMSIPSIKALINRSVVREQDHFDYSVVNEQESYRLMVLPRSKNKSHEMNIIFDDNQLQLFAEELSTDMANHFSSLTGPHKDATKFDFVANIRLRWSIAKYIPIKYDEKEHMYYRPDEVELHDLIQKRLKNIKTNLDKQDKNKAAKLERKDPPFETYCEYFKVNQFERLYKKPEEALHDKVNVQSCPYYSVIHSLSSGFVFYAYNYSHRIKDCTKFVHRCSKIKLCFPSHPNMFIIFHSRLVHSGAESRIASFDSFHEAHDMRCFSYVHKKPAKQEIRRSHRLTANEHGYEQQRGDVNRILTNCDDAKDKCDKCSKMCGKDEHRKKIVIDLGEQYRRRKADTKWKDHLPICGDLFDLGWEVHLGVNMRNVKKYHSMKTELHCMMFGKNYSNRWKELDNTQRRYFVVKDDMKVEEQRMKSFPNTVEFFEEIQRKLNTQCIGGTVLADAKDKQNDKYIMINYAVLANCGFLMEQGPHRDYPTSS